MNLTVDGRKVYVTLSVRNLETLLNKVKRAESKKTLMRITGNGYVLVVTAEDNVTHYAERTPGAIHPLDDPKAPEAN